MKSQNPVLLSTAYLPPVHYFMLMMRAEKVYIEKHETYLKQTYRNRCEIYTANGKLPLTIPVNRVNGNHTKIDEVQIAEQYNWQTLHWRAIKTAYSNSPYFLYFSDEIQEFYQKKFTNLFDFNHQQLQQIFSLLGIEKEICFTDSFEKNPQGIDDNRYSISPKVASDNFAFKTYYQSFSEKHGFIPGLSILDLIFNMGGEAKGIIS